MRYLKMFGALMVALMALTEAAHPADPHVHPDEQGFVTIDTRNYAAATCNAWIVVPRR